MESCANWPARFSISASGAADFLDQPHEDLRGRGILHRAEDRVVVHRLADVPALLAPADVGRRAATAERRVDLHHRREHGIAERDRVATRAGLARGLLDALAERLEQQLDTRLLGGLRLVVGRPVLRVLLALRGRRDLAAFAHVALPRQPEHDRLLVLARRAARLEVGARAGLRDDVDHVGRRVRGDGLRRHRVAGAELANAAALGDLATALLARRGERRERLCGSNLGCCVRSHDLNMVIKRAARKVIDAGISMAIVSPWFPREKRARRSRESAGLQSPTPTAGTRS